MQSTKIKIIAMIIAALLVVGGLTAWLVVYKPFDRSYKNVTIMLVDENGNEFKTGIERTNAASLGELLKEEEEKYGIQYTTGIYGIYISSIGNKTLTLSQWVCVMAQDNVEMAQYLDVSDWGQQLTLKKVNYRSTTVGADMLPLTDGQTYVLAILSY